MQTIEWDLFGKTEESIDISKTIAVVKWMIAISCLYRSRLHYITHKARVCKHFRRIIFPRCDWFWSGGILFSIEKCIQTGEKLVSFVRCLPNHWVLAMKHCPFFEGATFGRIIWFLPNVYYIHMKWKDTADKWNERRYSPNGRRRQRFRFESTLNKLIVANGWLHARRNGTRARAALCIRVALWVLIEFHWPHCIKHNYAFLLIPND